MLEIQEKNRREIDELAEQSRKLEEQVRETRERNRRELEELNRRAEEQQRQIRQLEEEYAYHSFTYHSFIWKEEKIKAYNRHDHDGCFGPRPGPVCVIS